jgi:hypothetical protein
LQDIKGLLSLNRPDRAKLARLLVACGAAEGDTDALIDALEDYQEPGKLKRVNGAKDFEYAAAGMRPPRGAPLLAEPEIWRVFGWAALEKAGMNNAALKMSRYSVINLLTQAPRRHVRSLLMA